MKRRPFVKGSARTAEWYRSYIESGVTIDPDSGCWIYGNAKAYPRLTVNGSFRPISRISLWCFKGEKLDDWRLACHHCDNPPCVNPDHLYFGSNADNLDDMMNRGRHWSQRIPKNILVALTKLRRAAERDPALRETLLEMTKDMPEPPHYA